MKQVTSLVATTLLAIAGTAGAQQAAPKISAEAAATFDQAVKEMKQAQARRNVWTTVGIALDEAKRAAAQGDSAQVIRLATLASEHARLSVLQADYPGVAE